MSSFAIMLRRVPNSRHPFRLLLYLEWILIAIATLTILSPLPIRPPRPASRRRCPEQTGTAYG